MAVKPTQTQAKNVFAYVNSAPTRRVQSFDWNSNFTIDSVFELGNAGLVEDVVTLVETNVTANSNEWGTTDLEAMMFGVHEQRNICSKTPGSDGNTIATLIVASRGVGGDWNSVGNATVAAGDWLQVIRYNSSATVNDAEYVKVISISHVAASLCNVIGLSPTYQLTAAATAGDVVTLINKYNITETTVDANPIHLVLPHRYSTASTVMMYSTLIPRCYVDNLSYSFDVGGACEQNYTLVGEEERLLLGSRRECQTVTGSYTDYSGATVSFTVPYESLSATGSPYILYAGSNMVAHSDYAFTHTSGQVTIQARIGANLGVDSSTDLVYYYTNKTKKGYRGLNNIDSSIGKLSKGYIKIQAQQSTGTVEDLQRCTGAALSFPLTREDISELGESRSVAKPLESNLRNEITLSFNRNDLREYAKLLGRQEPFDLGSSGTMTEILMTDLKSVNDVTIYVKLYNSQTTHDATTLLKTFTFENCNFIGDSNTSPISGAAGLDLNFSSESLSLVGSGLPPTY